MKIVMLGSSLEQNGGIATVEKLILKHVSNNIEIQHITTHDEGSIKYRLMIFSQAIVKFLWRLISQKTDVVYVHLADGGSALRKALIALIAFIFHKPVLMHTHGAEFYVKYSRFPKLLRWWLNSIFRQCYGFIVLSNASKEFYILNLGLNPEKVFVLPNPTELPEQIPKRLNVDKVTIIFCGRVGQRKGTFDLIKAFANLSINTKNNSQLIIAGDGDTQEGLNLVENFNLTTYINFIGWIDSEQRDKLLADSDLFILPSYNEGLPMAILEAMSWGLPIITTPVGGIPEVVIDNQNGLLITPGNIQQLSQAMQSLIENETLRLSLGKAARETATHFDVSNYSCHLSDILTQCFNKHNERMFGNTEKRY